MGMLALSGHTGAVDYLGEPISLKTQSLPVD
jgi:hypothetical protein